MKEILVAKQKESAEIAGMLESLQEQLKEYEDLKQKQSSLEQATKQVEEENVSLRAEEEELSKVQREWKEDFDLSRMELDKAKENELRVEALVQYNDRREEEEVRVRMVARPFKYCFTFYKKGECTDPDCKYKEYHIPK